MRTQIHKLNEEQQTWYSFLIATAVKADKEVDQSEIDFIILTLHFLDAPAQKKIKSYLNSPGIFPNLDIVPKGLSKEQLALIYTELIAIVVSDGRLTTSEKSFLKSVSEWFGFSKVYFGKMLQWAESLWENENTRRKLITNPEA